ncbi:MAG: hypothetical protein H7288_08325 [Kineosporiaceae bacterium]|nr:hypothetical protein [Aeromicrobium sp.]
MNRRSDTACHEILKALVDRLPTIAWDRIPEAQRTVEWVAQKMVASLPSVMIGDPPVGACYTARGLALWRGVTRQAIHQQRRAGRIVGFKHGNTVVYPAFQFSHTGRMLPIVRDMLETHLTALDDATEIAAWLDKIHSRSGLSPRQMIAVRADNAVGRRIDTGSRRLSAVHGLPELSQVRIVDPEKLTPGVFTTESP